MTLAQSAVAQGVDLPAPFMRSVAAEAAGDEVIAAFYRDRDYAPLWTGAADQTRRGALFAALSRAGDHGLPVARYDLAALQSMLTAAVTEGDRARAEVALSRAYLAYARDVSSGALDPIKVDPGIVREIARPDPANLLAAMAGPDPARVLQGLLPKSADYTRLMRARLDLEARIARGGWGPTLRPGALASGAQGEAVVALRDRLVAMGYLARSASGQYDAAIQNAVQRFQIDHGLKATGAVDDDTLGALNVAPETRLKSIIVAMERQRWMGDAPLGDRHIWVNLPDFSTRIVENGKIAFETRSVIGKDVLDQHTPEFSDMMDHLVINPSWGVPRSIIVKEYLPLLQRNPNAVSYMQLIDSRGRVVPRGSVNFGAYSARSFPYGMRQPPSDGNALGKVKFMFPNKYNIYLHDTPAKNLFSHDVRAYSHGCIRLADPFDFAYALLALQSDDPAAEFQRHLRTGRESPVKLEKKVPIHLVYFTAWPGSRGQMTYRDDVYGRDAKLFQALEAAGVVLPALRG